MPASKGRFRRWFGVDFICSRLWYTICNGDSGAGNQEIRNHLFVFRLKMHTINRFNGPVREPFCQLLINNPDVLL